MEFEQSFLGTGWSFPPEFDRKTRSVQLTSGEEDIQKSLQILLATRLGERVMVPEYGCNLEDLLFETVDLTLKTYVKDLIKTAILYFEPRIDVHNIEIDTTNEWQGELLIKIDYLIRITNSRGNLVFPFYKEEGTEVS
ncbi:MAG: hypothetical protein CMC35_06735 [Flavobacteriaceae bacterium]|nr:hypothetical protein [Flavobacteriaceae bacterium]|tara:strand:+ start:3708 stop:4121 length:414 start_codon:yes stop_codon:yes gene_type:complete